LIEALSMNRLPPTVLIQPIRSHSSGYELGWTRDPLPKVDCSQIVAYTSNFSCTELDMLLEPFSQAQRPARCLAGKHQ